MVGTNTRNNNLTRWVGKGASLGQDYSKISNNMSLGGLTEGFEQERQSKYQSGLGVLQQIASLFGPDYMKGEEQKDLAALNADMASRGLASTTLPSSLSAGVKRQYSDIRKTRLADALAMISQFMQQSAPTPGLVSQTATSANTALRNPGALWEPKPFSAFPSGAPRGWNDLG
jgi:hypothetical protein